MLLKDKVIMVSGVAPGLGQALARLSASEGAHVVTGASLDANGGRHMAPQGKSHA